MANQWLFLVMLALTALFIPFASPNVISTVYDITLPEVRSTALSIQSFIESAGAALSPLIAGLIADRSSLHDDLADMRLDLAPMRDLLPGVALVVPHDIGTLRAKCRRAPRQSRPCRRPAGP